MSKEGDAVRDLFNAGNCTSYDMLHGMAILADLLAEQRTLLAEVRDRLPNADRVDVHPDWRTLISRERDRQVAEWLRRLADSTRVHSMVNGVLQAPTDSVDSGILRLAADRIERGEVDKP